MSFSIEHPLIENIYTLEEINSRDLAKLNFIEIIHRETGKQKSVVWTNKIINIGDARDVVFVFLFVLSCF